MDYLCENGSSLRELGLAGVSRRGGKGGKSSLEVPAPLGSSLENSSTPLSHSSSWDRWEFLGFFGILWDFMGFYVIEASSFWHFAIKKERWTELRKELQGIPGISVLNKTGN